MANPDDPSMRASDADREAAAERLRIAFEEGRLTVTEYDERVQRAYGAVTLADLATLTGDLPLPPKPPVEVENPRRKELAKEWRDWSGTAFVLVGIWLVASIASGVVLFFWPIIPMGIWAVVILAGMFFGDDPKDS